MPVGARSEHDRKSWATSAGVRISAGYVTPLLTGSKAADMAILVPFEEKSGALCEGVITIGSRGAQLSFPHGIGISEDGRYLAIANYGDDKLAIYAPWGEVDLDRSSAS